MFRSNSQGPIKEQPVQQGLVVTVPQKVKEPSAASAPVDAPGCH
jgi:hypothetical protein